VTYVKEFSLDGKEITVKRALENGYEVIKLRMPCVLTAIKELNKPRYMSVKGIHKACRKKISVWNAKDINVDLTTVGLAASPTNVYRSFTPAPKGTGVLIDGKSAKETVGNLMRKLRENHIV
jgi:electron transfer flavoprotein alpha/beta subunit